MRVTTNRAFVRAYSRTPVVAPAWVLGLWAALLALPRLIHLTPHRT
ncbi:MAG TPA: hypothetical protein VNT01_07150 [Symbiobacteriaceae bacterium]|nr:hypothetical protein [Symbiobacteriaceae bacterium]